MHWEPVCTLIKGVNSKLTECPKWAISLFPSCKRTWVLIHLVILFFFFWSWCCWNRSQVNKIVPNWSVRASIGGRLSRAGMAVLPSSGDGEQLHWRFESGALPHGVGRVVALDLGALPPHADASFKGTLRHTSPTLLCTAVRRILGC